MGTATGKEARIYGNLEEWGPGPTGRLRYRGQSPVGVGRATDGAQDCRDDGRSGQIRPPEAADLARIGSPRWKAETVISVVTRPVGQVSSAHR
ncbi:MAG: hypothetical protein ACE5NA_09165 [Nitrospiraceae bacterium]